MNEATVLAVDGGGTGCRAALCSKDGNILAYARGNSCNYHSIGIEQATANLFEVFTALTRNRALHIRYAVLGLAGLDTQKDHDILTTIVKQALLAAQLTAGCIRLYNDALLTLKGSVGQNNGVLLAAGTGSIAYGVTRNGLETRVGGWGYRAGDEGSGYWIGKAALTHVLKSYDGRDERSGITTAVLQELALADEEELVNWIYCSRFSVTQVAALTPVIARLAAEGDRQAQKILHCACRELSELSLTVIRKLDLIEEEFSLVLSGGVLTNPLVRRQLIQQLSGTCPGLRLADLNWPPVCAGLRHGLVMAGFDKDTLLNQLAAQLTALPNRTEPLSRPDSAEIK